LKQTYLLYFLIFICTSFINGATKSVKHSIKKGDSLYTLAKQYSTTVTLIRETNKIKNGEILDLGRALIIPINTYFNGLIGYSIEKGDTLSTIANKFNTTLDALMNLNKLSKTSRLHLGQVLKIPKKTFKSNKLKTTDIVVDKTIKIVKKVEKKIVKKEKKEVKKEFNIVKEVKKSKLKKEFKIVKEIKKITPKSGEISATEKFVTYITKKGDVLFNLAKKYNTTISEIKKSNNIIDEYLKPKMKIKIPYNTYFSELSGYTLKRGDNLSKISKIYKTTSQSILDVNGMEDESEVEIGMMIMIPENTYIPKYVIRKIKKPKAKVKIVKKSKEKILKKMSFRQKSNKFVEYKIKKGDTAFTIARKHHTTIKEVLEANKLKKNTMLKLGRVLKVPYNTYFSGLAGYYIKKGDTLFTIARKYHTTVAEVREVNKIKRGTHLKLGRLLKVPQNTYNPNGNNIRLVIKEVVKKKSKIIKYRIKKGDTLYKIAKNNFTTVKSIRKLNNLKRRRVRLKRGKTLKVAFNTLKKSPRLIALARKRAKKKSHRILITRSSMSSAVRIKRGRVKRKSRFRVGDIFYSSLRNSSSSKARGIISLAKRKLGRRYVWGATGGRNTFDCSGLTSYVYKHNGIKLPRRAIAQSRVGKRISRRNLRKGDLIFFDTSRRRRGYVNHVGIYIGNNRFIHASSAKHKVVITSLNKPFYSQRFKIGRRL